MPKIENWSKVEPTRLQGAKAQWENDSESGQDVFIESGGGIYPVIFQDRQRRERMTIAARPETLEEARKKAVEWMKDNPNPVFAPGI